MKQNNTTSSRESEMREKTKRKKHCNYNLFEKQKMNWNLMLALKIIGYFLHKEK